jgi:hypothetical protein
MEIYRVGDKNQAYLQIFFPEKTLAAGTAENLPPGRLPCPAV